MRYLTFKMPSEEGKESTKTSALEKILAWLLEKFIPKANPDFDAKYDDVETWFIEYDEENDYTNREIGLDKDGHVIVLGPFQSNLGYWVDNDFTLQNYEDYFDVKYIDKAVFEELWREIETKQAILSFLTKWNPIGVPEDIAKDEYIDYVDLIESSLQSKDELRKCLIGILRETMGLNISSPEAFADIENACDELIKLKIDK